jgi:hypothetical protein
MLNLSKMNLFLKYKKFKFILFLFYFFIPLTIVYFSVPKLFNFSLQSIKTSLKTNSNIIISEILEVDYKIFPTPRLKILSNKFIIGDESIEVIDGELEIILNVRKIFSFKEINYKKILISKGISNINLNNINQLLTSVNGIKKNLLFQKNKIIFYQKDNAILEINDSTIKINQIKKKKELAINGNFLNNKIYVKLENTKENKNNLIFKIPKLDIATRIFFNKNNPNEINGFFNLEVFNNLLKFNFTKSDSIKLSDGFIRSKLLDSSVEGEVKIKPNFFLKLDLSVSNLDMKKFFPIIKKNYFSGAFKNLHLIKKINSTLDFKSKFQGRIRNTNGEILFENFRVGKNKDFYINAVITEFGKKGKIQFNLTKLIQHKRNLSKKIEITGILIPSSSRVIFESFSVDENKLTAKKTKEYEIRLKDDLIQDSISNIFNENKIEKFLKNLF